MILEMEYNCLPDDEKILFFEACVNPILKNLLHSVIKKHEENILQMYKSEGETAEEFLTKFKKEQALKDFCYELLTIMNRTIDFVQTPRQ